MLGRRRMAKTLATLAAAAMLVVGSAAPSVADSGFHPLRIARDAANLGLNTARRAVDLGLDTAEGAAGVAHDAVKPDRCRHGTHYRDKNGHRHTCR
jgi:hypothetical protein